MAKPRCLADATTTPLPIHPDQDPLLVELTAAAFILERARGELMSPADMSGGAWAVAMRRAAIDVEVAAAKIASAIQRRGAEL